MNYLNAFGVKRHRHQFTVCVCFSNPEKQLLQYLGSQFFFESQVICIKWNFDERLCTIKENSVKFCPGRPIPRKSSRWYKFRRWSMVVVVAAVICMYTQFDAPRMYTTTKILPLLVSPSLHEKKLHAHPVMSYLWN